jgi:serine protease inhibitor
MNDRPDDSRVQPLGDDDESLREYGRQLALDSLLELALNNPQIGTSTTPEAQSPATPKRASAPRDQKWLWLVAALAASVLLGLMVWQMLRPVAPVEPHPIQEWASQDEKPDVPVKEPAKEIELAAGWRIEPTGKAVYRVLDPDRIQLDRGELLVESVAPGASRQRPQLIIETPNGKAIAKGTKFIIGTHAEVPTVPSRSKGPRMSTLTRVLILTGVVTLVTAHGSITGQANHLLAAEAEKAPANHAITANTDFAIDLYRQLAKENAGKNLFFSPYSISSALAMTAEGARGETAAEMGKVLRFPKAAARVGDDAQLIPWNTALIHTGIAELNERFTTKPVPKELRDKLDATRKAVDESKRKAEELKAAKQRKEYRAELERTRKLEEELRGLSSQVDQYEIRVANALWGEKTFPFAKEYVATINKHYRTGGLFPVDFRGQPEVERTKINSWVEEQTNNRIKDLLPKGVLNGDTRLVLTNAIYFKGDWQELFAESDTKEADFTVSAGTKVRVPLMHKDGMKAVRYAAFDAEGKLFKTPEFDLGKSKGNYPGKGGFQMAELPYKGGELAMLVLLPQDADGLAELEKKLSSESLRTWTSNLESRKVNVSLPKFKLETDYEMNETLKAMGMVRAFDPAQAQFDGLSENSKAASGFHISKVLHKAFVEVNEKGTEAAAATAVLMARSSAGPFIPTFRADKPFLYAIRDVKTGTILFLGRMSNPK